VKKREKTEKRDFIGDSKENRKKVKKRRNFTIFEKKTKFLKKVKKRRNFTKNEKKTNFGKK